MARSFSGKDDSAVENLLSQAKDLYVLEQVAKINCSGFTDDSSLPTNLETRFRRLKTLPVSRAGPVLSSSKKLLSHSSMASYPDKKNLGNVSSASALSSFSRHLAGTSCPLDSSVDDETNIFSGIKRNPSVNSQGALRSSSRFSREGKIYTPRPTPILKLLPKEKSRISLSRSTSIGLALPSSDQDQKERLNRKSKSKSKFLISWFDKLSLAQAMGCLQGKSSSNSKKTEEMREEELYWKGTQRIIRKGNKAVKRSRGLRSESNFDHLLGMLF